MAEEKCFVTDETVIELAIERLTSFEKHPYRVIRDRQMEDLISSIKRYGILDPLIVRPRSDGTYEIISGHRRKYAAQELGFTKVPALIRILDDDEAVIAMVDANLHREQILYSEKAFSYKMKYEALKRKNYSKGSSRVGARYLGKKTVQILAEQNGDSPRQIQRYLKLTELIPELLNWLDNGIISFNPAVELAFLSVREQKLFMKAVRYTNTAPSLSQAQRIKALSQSGDLSLEALESILGEIKKGEIERVTFKNSQLLQYFPKGYTPEMMRKDIIRMLRDRKETAGH